MGWKRPLRSLSPTINPTPPCTETAEHYRQLTPDEFNDDYRTLKIY